MGTVIGSVRLFGTMHAVFGGRDGRWTELWFDNIERHEWEQLPDEGVLLSDRHPVKIRVRYGKMSFFTADDLGELKKEGLQLIWRSKNPNGFRLKQVRERYTTEVETFEAHQRAMARDDMRAIEFKWEGREWKGHLWDEKSHTVYKPSQGVNLIVPGRMMACSWKSTPLVKPAKPDQAAFRLMIVDVHREHIHPDELIARLERDIAAGKP